MAWYVFVGMLAAFGGLCLLWGLFGWLLPAGKDGVLILPGRPGGDDLAFARRYLWLRELGLLRCSMMVADMGLSRAEKTWLERHGIELLDPGVLPPGFGIGAEEIDGTGNGDSSGNHQRGGVPEL